MLWVAVGLALITVRWLSDSRDKHLQPSALRCRSVFAKLAELPRTHVLTCTLCD